MPSVLTELLTIKKEEIELALKSPLSAHNVKKGRSPKKGSKGYKLLIGKENELQADRKLKRYNIVSLLEKLYEALDGVKTQDTLIENV